MIEGWTRELTAAAQRHAARGFSFAPFTVDQVVALTCASFLGSELLILSGHENQLPLRSALRSLGAVIEIAEQTALRGAGS